jgi:hypothetical protein
MSTHSVVSEIPTEVDDQSVTGSVRHEKGLMKLIVLEYLEQEAMEQINLTCTGMSQELAKKYPENLRAHIQNIQFTPPKRELDARQNIMYFTRHLDNSIQKALEAGGDGCLEKAVKSNLQLVNLQTEKKLQIKQTEDEIRRLEGIKRREPKPPIEREHQCRYEINVENETIRKKEASMLAFANRISGANARKAADQVAAQAAAKAAAHAAAQATVPTTTTEKASEKKGTKGGNKASVDNMLKSPPRQHDRSAEVEQLEQAISTGTFDLQTYEQSVEYERFRNEMEDFTRKANLQYKKAYVDEIDKYREDTIEYQNALERLEVLEYESKIASIYYQIIIGLSTAIGEILSKVYQAVKDYPEVRERLSWRCPLSNQPGLNDPLNQGNLCGVYYLLHTQYNSATLSGFCNQLLEIMSLRLSEYDSTHNIMKGPEIMDKQINLWQQMKYYEFMTRDYFFTVMLLHMYTGDERVRFIMETLRYIEDHQHEITTGNSHFMPVYTHITHFIRDICNNTMIMSKTKALSLQTPRNNYNNNRNRVQFAGAEQAAAANSLGEDAVGPYNGEVTRESNLFITDVNSGNRFIYTATKSKCPKCEKKVRAQSCGTPLCYLAQCKKCGMFGHKMDNCKQSIVNGGKAVKG